MIVGQPPDDTWVAQSPTVRIIAAEYQPAVVFERIADPALLEAAIRLEALTAPETLATIGALELVPPEDRIAGRGAGWIMTAFTRPGRPSRFTDGSFGVYYASWSEATAVVETSFHWSRWLAAHGQSPTRLGLQILHADFSGQVCDLRGARVTWPAIYDPEHYVASQAFGRAVRARRSDGIVYDSVRDAGGTCVAVFRPPALRRARRVGALIYEWDGRAIADMTRNPP